MSEVNIIFGCTDHFSELCAVSTAGSLTAEEWDMLEAHLARCPQCARLVAEYRETALGGMAVLAAARGSSQHSIDQEWDRSAVKAKFLTAISAADPLPAQLLRRAKSAASLRWLPQLSLSRPNAFLAAAAVLIVAVLIGVQIGYRRAGANVNQVAPSSHALEASLRRQVEEVQAERDTLKQEVADGTNRAASLQDQVTRAEKQAAKLETMKASLIARIDALTAQNQQQSSAVAQLTSEKASLQQQSSAVAQLTSEKTSLQQQLRATEDALRTVRQNFDSFNGERQRVLLRAESLQTEVDRLSAQVRDYEQSSQRQYQYLVSDRDIRELMGARQLYIADVFDVDSQGKSKKPFGRVFYTKGKSLIFYAFDLEREPGFREAKTFQAWGSSGATQATPVSLGIFYVDNESNRRWVLKFDDPKVLGEINAVFVTVEPKDGSKRPTTKPFLLAYLHSPSVNHP